LATLLEAQLQHDLLSGDGRRGRHGQDRPDRKQTGSPYSRMEMEGRHIRIRISGWIICIPVKLGREAYGRVFHNAIQKMRRRGS